MSTDGVNTSRRRFLITATSVVGAVGAGFVAVPFVSSMEPSARTQAAGAPVEADFSKLELGSMITVAWRGKPVWILRRTKQNLADLKTLDSQLRDPNSLVDHQPPYCKNEYRSRKPEYFIVVGICTHLGCSPTYRPDIAPPDLGPKWKGGYFCPCHGSRYDLAGRVYKGVPAPTNLVVPRYMYLADTRVTIGNDEGGAA